MSTIEFGGTSQVEPRGAASNPAVAGLDARSGSGAGRAPVDSLHDAHPVAALRSSQQEAIAVACVSVVGDWITRIDRPRMWH